MRESVIVKSSKTWWHLAVVAVTVVVGFTIFAYDYGDDSGHRIAGAAALVGFVIAWFAIGQFATEGSRLAAVYAVVLIVGCGVGTAINPNFATMQTVAYPLLWTRASSTKSAILASAALAASVAIGFVSRFGPTQAAIVQAAVIAGLSFGFSVAMGLWISRIWSISDERQALVVELQEAQASLASLHRDLGITSERERLAREIHDTIAQDLTGIVMLSQQARRSLTAGDEAATDEQLAMLEENARLALSETRALVAATAPAALDDGGIGPALERLGARFTRESGILVSVEVDAATPVDRANEVVLLRCAQEALANVRKHSGATSAVVTLTVAPTGTTLAIADNGSGFDPTTVDRGFGIAGMRDRLALVAGELELETSPAGTRLVATLPGGAA